VVTSNDGLKAEQEYSAEDSVNIKVTRNGGLKAEQKYSAVDCVATMVTSNGGLKAQWEYSPGQRPGEEGIAILRSERAKGMGRIASELPPAALSECKLLSSLTPRVVPWAIYLLGLRPVITHKDE